MAETIKGLNIKLGLDSTELNAINEFKRIALINKDIVRQLIIKLDEEE